MQKSMILFIGILLLCFCICAKRYFTRNAQMQSDINNLSSVDNINDDTIIFNQNIPNNSNSMEITNCESNLLEKLKKEILNNNSHFYINIHDSDDECPICLEELGKNQKIRVLECMHKYHKKCFDQWFLNKNHINIICPICNYT